METSFTLTNQRYQRSTPKPVALPFRPPVPRLSRLMALAIRFDGLIRDGSVADQAELARMGSVSRTRLTQIMLLLHLAPDIQEELLFLSGDPRLVERDIRPLLHRVLWSEQREAFEELKRGL